MPTVLRVGQYRFFFYSNEGLEPPHIHVSAANAEAKFWLESIIIVWNHGFNQRQLGQIEQQIREHQNMMLETWQKYFGA